MANHVITIDDGVAVLECNASSNAMCRVKWNCACEEWPDCGIDDDGRPWHTQYDWCGIAPRHYGEFGDPKFCNYREFVSEQGVLDSQRPGSEFAVSIPVKVQWTGYGVEWLPEEG